MAAYCVAYALPCRLKAGTALAHNPTRSADHILFLDMKWNALTLSLLLRVAAGPCVFFEQLEKSVMAHAYQRPGSAMLLAAATLLSLVAIAAAGTCHVNIPKVPGIDQSPTNPSDWGKCTNLEGSFGKYSHWCKFGKLGSYPTPPTQKAQECLKFGRASIYRGPIYGSSAGHLGACNRILRGNDKFAMVAVSTKYLKTYQGGWTSNRGACHQCMCIRLQGGDDAYNKGLQKDSVDAHRGLTFLGKVRTASISFLQCTAVFCRLSPALTPEVM